MNNVLNNKIYTVNFAVHVFSTVYLFKLQFFGQINYALSKYFFKHLDCTVVEFFKLKLLVA